MPKKFIANVVYQENKIPEKDVLPVYVRVIGKRIHNIIGTENMYQFCRKCKELKNEKEFNVLGYDDNYGRKKLGFVCRTCQNKKDMDIYYLKKENGPPASHCELCGNEAKTQLDHCHITRKFRGWLCHSCNLGLGKLQDSVDLLERAIKYLKGEKK